MKREIEVTIARTDTTEIERGYTGQRGQDEQNRRARKAAVQTPGKALTSRNLGLSSDAGFQKPEETPVLRMEDTRLNYGG